MKFEFKKSDGILYSIFCFIIEILFYANLVEGFKKVSLFRVNSKNHLSEDKITERNRIGTDTFILVKWVVISLFWYYNLNSNIVIFITWYLIISNLYTYFYYHVWDEESLKKVKDVRSLKRRFLNLLLAISFSNFCFAFLYAEPYHYAFKYSTQISNYWQSIWYSINNSLAANYDAVEIYKWSECGHFVTMIQLIITFVFLSIIIGNSIPENKQD